MANLGGKYSSSRGQLPDAYSTFWKCGEIGKYMLSIFRLSNLIQSVFETSEAFTSLINIFEREAFLS
jgi:hypothetical protein